MPNNNSVAKSNHLIEASYKLSLQSQKLILACLSKLDSRAEIPKTVSISAMEFADIMNLDRSSAYKELYSAADALYNASITLIDNNDDIELRWIQKRVKKTKGEGQVTLTWSDDVVKYISQLKSRFTTYKIKHIADLQSTYSLRIYELLMRFNDTGIRKISVDDFRKALCITDKYKTFKILRRDVINPSIKELNKRSNLNIEFETVKKGRSVTSLYFSFSVRKEVQQELDL